MYEILVYLFENCHHAELSHDRARVEKKLEAAGFDESDISEAMRWMAGVVLTPQRSLAPLPEIGAAYRAFSAKELAKLDAECRGFLLTLEHCGILTPQTREHVLERALAASGPALSLEQLKLIVLMVQWNLGTPTSRLLAEDLFTSSANRVPH